MSIEPMTERPQAIMLLDELKAVQAIKDKIKWLDELISGLESASQRVTQGLCAGPRSTISSDKMAEEVSGATDRIRELFALQIEYTDRTLEIERRLDKTEVSQQHREILRYVYLKGYATKRRSEDGDLYVPAWGMIADEMHYNEKYCRQLLREAKEAIRYVQAS